MSKIALYRKECIIALLAIASLVLLAADKFLQLSVSQFNAIYVFDVFVGFIFMSEFMFDLWLAHNRKRFIKQNWVYLLAAIPLPYGWVQILRGIRLLRAIKLMRFGIHYKFESRGK